MIPKIKKRNQNIRKLRIRIEKKLKKNVSSFWLKKFQKNGIPSTKINKISELFKNPQVKNRKMIIDYKDALIKKLKLAGNPLKFNFDKVNRNCEEAPELNANKKEILKYILD